MKFDWNNGLLLAFLAAFISGLAIFINGFAVKLADPFSYTLLKNVGALILLVVVFVLFNQFKHFESISKKQWLSLAFIGIIGGSIPFLLFFWGLKLTGAVSGSFVFRSLFIFAGLFGYLLMKEKPSHNDLLAGLLILSANFFLLEKSFAFSFGHLLILIATVFWALDYSFSRKLLNEINPKTVMLSRMFFGSIILIALLGFNNSLPSIESILDFQLLFWLFIVSILLAGFLLLWYSCLKFLPVFRATVILSLGGLVTFFLDVVFLKKTLMLNELIALSLLFFAFIAVSGLFDKAFSKNHSIN